jgi:hypothetical protein
MNGLLSLALVSRYSDKLRARRSGGSNPSRGQEISSPKRLKPPKRLFGLPHMDTMIISRGTEKEESVKLTAHLHVVSRLRTIGTIFLIQCAFMASTGNLPLPLPLPLFTFLLYLCKRTAA